MGVVNNFLPLVLSQEGTLSIMLEEAAPPVQSSPLQMGIQAFRGWLSSIRSMSQMMVYGRSSFSTSREVVGEVTCSNNLVGDGIIVSAKQHGDTHPLVPYELLVEEVHVPKNIESQLASKWILKQWGDNPSKW